MKTTGLLFIALVFATAASAALHTDVEYARVGDVSLKLDAYVPEGSGPFPAVILVHGGGWTGGDKSGGPKKAYIAPMHEPLARAGFAWFSINYRLAPQHRYPACIDDVETAIRWVKRHASEYRLDPKRIAISGESAGGHLVALAVVRADESTRLAAVVPFYGAFDLVSRAPPGEPLMRNFSALLGRTHADEAALALLREASPLAHVKPGLPPFLLVHGNADNVVPYDQSLKLQARLKAAGVRCDLLTIEQGGHGMLGWKSLGSDYQDQIVAWLKRTLAISIKP